MIKVELLEIIKKEKNNYEKKIVNKLAAEYGVTILRLPPYHCELNLIELVWAQVKGHVARHNESFKMADIKKLFSDGLKLVTL
jgi:transposase